MEITFVPTFQQFMAQRGAEDAREVSREMWAAPTGGHDPLVDVNHDVVAHIRKHHAELTVDEEIILVDRLEAAVAC